MSNINSRRLARALYVGVSGSSEKQVNTAISDVVDWLKALIAASNLEAQVVTLAPLGRTKRLVVRSDDPNWLERLLRYVSRRAPHTNRGSVRVTFELRYLVPV